MGLDTDEGGYFGPVVFMYRFINVTDHYCVLPLAFGVGFPTSTPEDRF